MKNLQEYLEEKPLEEVKKLSKFLSKENFTTKELIYIFDIIKKIYETEMDIDLPNNEKLMEDLFLRLRIQTGLYINVQMGFLKINKGTIELKDGECSFSLTELGKQQIKTT